MNIESQILSFIKNNKTIENFDYQSIKWELYKYLFSKIPVISNKIPKGSILFRTLPVERSDLSIGTKEALSYRPKYIDYPHFNRCSEPQQTHFYCSDDRHLSISEVSYFLGKAEDPEPKFEKDSEYLEVGMWEVQRDLYVADLRFGLHSDKESLSHINKIKELYRSFSKDRTVIDFFEFINQAFEVPIKKTERAKYWLTACYSNYLYDDQFIQQADIGTLDELKGIERMSLDGIMYHSVKGISTNFELKGVNFSLITDVVDMENIKLIKAGIFKSLQKDATTFDLDQLIKINTTISSDTWCYRDPVPSDFDKNYMP